MTMSIVATEQVSITVTNENQEENRKQKAKRGIIQGVVRGGQSCLQVLTTGWPHTSFSEQQNKTEERREKKKKTMAAVGSRK